MNEITEKLKKLEDIPILTEKLYKYKSKKDEMIKNIKLIEKEKYVILDNLEDSELLKKKLSDVENEILKMEAKNVKIEKIEDLKFLSDDLMRVKIFDFIGELIYEWSFEEKTVVLSKETTKFFRFIKDKEFYKEAKKKYFRLMEKCFENVVPVEIKFEDNEKEIYVSVENYVNDCNLLNEKKENILNFYRINKEISNFLFELLKKNIKNRAFCKVKNRDENIKIFLEENRQVLMETKFNFDVDLFYEEILLISLKNESLQDRNTFKICTEKENCNFSEDYVTLLFIIEKIDLKKHFEIIKSSLELFFDSNKIEKGLFNYFCIFNEINHALKNFYISEFKSLKEIFFGLIMKNCGIDELNFDDKFEVLKIDILEVFTAFNEIMNFFVDEIYSAKFIESFFDILSTKKIDYIFEKKDLPIQESEKISELINFIFQIFKNSVEYPNYCKLKCIDDVLNSSLKDIEKGVKEKIFCLTKNELLKLVEALFNDSEKRKKIIEKIKNNGN
ncbi:hypothetical protein GVAV_001838 [Gurleya vavrai]